MTKQTTNARYQRGRRRRRKPEAAESEILSAAENFLREFPLRDLTVDNLMDRTGLSRPSFYGYFRDRSQLIINLTERLGERNRAMADPWISGRESVSDLSGAIRDLAQFYVTEGHLLRALSDAAGSDRLVELSYRRLLDSLIEGIAEKIRTEVDSGTTPIKNYDPREIATALLLMSEGYLIEKLGRQPQAPPKVVANTLLTIWLRVLYGSEPSR